LRFPLLLLIRVTTQSSSRSLEPRSPRFLRADIQRVSFARLSVRVAPRPPLLDSLSIYVESVWRKSWHPPSFIPSASAAGRRYRLAAFFESTGVPAWDRKTHSPSPSNFIRSSKAVGIGILRFEPSEPELALVTSLVTTTPKTAYSCYHRNEETA
jgi:hypothetical protein